MDVKFDERLALREDILWLNDLESRQASIIQTMDVLVLVGYDPIRSRSNESIYTMAQTFSRIRKLDSLLAFGFLFGIGLRTLLLKYCVRLTRLVYPR